MGLMEPLIGQVLTTLIYNYIQNHVNKVCKDSFDTSHIESLEKVRIFVFDKKNYCCVAVGAKCCYSMASKIVF